MRSIDFMMRIDNRTEDDIVKIIDWCQKDSFWKSNILSTAKLREKYDQLSVKINQTPKQYNSYVKETNIDRAKRILFPEGVPDEQDGNEQDTFINIDDLVIL